MHEVKSPNHRQLKQNGNPTAPIGTHPRRSRHGKRGAAENFDVGISGLCIRDVVFVVQRRAYRAVAKVEDSGPRPRYHANVSGTATGAVVHRMSHCSEETIAVKPDATIASILRRKTTYDCAIYTIDDVKVTVV